MVILLNVEYIKAVQHFFLKTLYKKHKKKKKVFLFDTFSGMPNTNPKIDNHLKGDFKDTSIDIVKKNLGDLTNIKIVDGFLPDSIKKVNLQKISFFCILI